MVAQIVSRWRKTRFLSDKDQRRLICALQNMRMSCNSTYLLDQETDHGVKADELAALLDELFVEPEAKAVCFQPMDATTISSFAGSKSVASATSASTAACPRTGARRWSSASVTTRLPRVPVDRRRRTGLDCSMPRPW